MNTEDNLIDTSWIDVCELERLTTTQSWLFACFIFLIVPLVFALPWQWLLFSIGIGFFIAILIYRKLTQKFIAQREQFHLSLDTNGIHITQAKDVGILFITPQQTEFVIPYVDIQYISLYYGIFSKNDFDMHIYLKKNGRNAGSLFSFLYVIPSTMFSLVNAPGVWNDRVQIPNITKNNADRLIQSLREYSNNASLSVNSSRKWLILPNVSIPKKRKIIYLVFIIFYIIFLVALLLF